MKCETSDHTIQAWCGMGCKGEATSTCQK